MVTASLFLECSQEYFAESNEKTTSLAAWIFLLLRFSVTATIDSQDCGKRQGSLAHYESDI